MTLPTSPCAGVDGHGERGDGLLLFAGLGGAHVPVPSRQGAFLISAPLLLPGIIVGTQSGGAPSFVTLEVPIPELGVGMEGLSVQLQSAFVAGADVLLGPAPSAVVLDAGL